MRPNIILIVVDSLRFDHVGPQKNGVSLTPFLDKISRQGIVFSQTTAQGPSTRVSMSAMLSSTYASLHGGEQRLSKDRPVIQQMLKEGGYTTAGITSNLYLSRFFGWQRGFDHFDDCRPDAVYRRKLGLRLANQITKRVGRPLVWPRALPAELVFENAGLFLRKAVAPFFIWVHLMDVHWPYAIQKFSWDPHFREQRRLDETIRQRLVAEQPRLTQKETEELIQQYKYSVQYTDRQIEAFYRRLEADGFLRNSWVVITADHGEEFLDHGRFFHHPTPFEELAHVPLVILPPQGASFERGRVFTGQTRLIDLVPTFLELAQVSPPAGANLYGTSLVPALAGQTQPDPGVALTESPHNQVLAARQGPWKYIWKVQQDERMLFNLAQDPGEKQNLVQQETLQAGVMHSVLEAHLEMARQAATNHGEEDDTELDTELVERLRGLGYVE